MTAEQKKLNRLLALRNDWKRSPSFKAYCQMVWDPVFFMECEDAIIFLDRLERIEREVLHPNNIKFLDVNEIIWEA